MREYARYEYAKEKCPICGCRNKVFTPVYEDEQSNCDRCKCGEREAYNVGFQLKCCNCGYIRVFRTNHLRNGNPFASEDDLVRGRDICFQPSPCYKKDCPLYGTCPDFWKKYASDASDWRKCGNGSCCDNNSNCNGNSNSGNEGVQTNKVIIELVPEEKFR